MFLKDGPPQKKTPQCWLVFIIRKWNPQMGSSFYNCQGDQLNISLANLNFPKIQSRPSKKIETLKALPKEW